MDSLLKQVSEKFETSESLETSGLENLKGK